VGLCLAFSFRRLHASGNDVAVVGPTISKLHRKSTRLMIVQSCASDRAPRLSTNEIHLEATNHIPIWNQPCRSSHAQLAQ
jgi:hypothetical protein